MLSMMFHYGFSSNHAIAADDNQEIEKTFVYECSAKSPIPGLEPVINHTPMPITITTPKRVAPGEEFYLENVIIGFPFDGLDNPYDEPISLELGSPNFKILSENQTSSISTFLDDTSIVAPPGHSGTIITLLTPEGGVEVGPFIAGDEGQVTLKAEQIAFNLYLAPTLPMSYTCGVPENEEFILATVDIDSESAIITLNGDNPMIVKQGDPYVEPGATAVDNFDGNVSDNIEISGDVDTSTIGEYTITYTVSDSVGNVATVERIVKVVEPFGHWFTGEGAPSDELGVNGDSYVDLLTGDIYKRDTTTWSLIGNLKGEDGNQGSEILTGSGTPSADAGDNGDLYLDTATGDLYQKSDDGWVLLSNLQGPGGPQGPQGPAGADGSGGGSGSGDGDGSSKKSGDGTKVTVKGDDDGKSSSGKGGKLPKTATSLPTLILVGSLFIVAGGVLFLRRRKAIE